MVSDPEGEGDAVANSSPTDPEAALRESMEGYDREISRERVAMSSSGQGMAAGITVPTMGTPGGAMVTVPNMPGGTSSERRNTGSGGVSDSRADGEADEKPEPKFEIPEDIAKATDVEDQVARQIREAAEQEENPRVREALWEEYRKHAGLRSK